MKKSVLRPILFCLLLLASLSAFYYVNYSQVDVFSERKEVVNNKSNERVEEQGVIFLDIELLKGIIKQGKDQLPSFSGF